MAARTKISEEERLFLLTEYERPLWEKGLVVCGMDEVGRGPLAGPVTAACVIMPKDKLIEGVNDSKKLSKKKLEMLYEIIMDTALGVGVGWVDEKTIDEINILQATRLAFKRAFANMDMRCDIALVDAVKDLDIGTKQQPIVHGDALSYSIAAASIVAKVERDRFMIKAAEKYPQYGFENNVGYGTKQHTDALLNFGPCEIHRRSFIKKYAAAFQEKGDL